MIPERNPGRQDWLTVAAILVAAVVAALGIVIAVRHGGFLG